MNLITKLTLLFVGIFIAVRIGLQVFDLEEEYFSTGIIVNMLLLLVSIFTGLHLAKKKEPVKLPFLSDFKIAFKSAMRYVVFSVLFIGIFYTIINPGYLEKRAATQIEAAMQQENYDLYKENLAKAGRSSELLSRPDYIDNQKNWINTINAPFGHITVSLLLLLFLAFIYSILVTIYFRVALQRHLS